MENNKEKYFEKIMSFFNQMAVVSIGSIDKNNNPWISNFYYRVDKDFKIYFITRKDNKYAHNVFLKNKVSFNIYWYDKENYLDRKSVQGVGDVRLADSDEVKSGINLFKNKFPQISSVISEKIFSDDMDEFRFWIVEPDFIKYLDDSEFGDLESVNIKIKYEEKKEN